VKVLNCLFVDILKECDSA